MSDLGPHTASGPSPGPIGHAIPGEASMLRKILDAHEDCIKVLDLSGHLVGLNAGGLVALELDTAASVLGRYWPDLWDGEGKGQAISAVATAAAGGVDRFVGQAATDKGNLKWWDVQVSPILDDQGAPASVLVVSRDITNHHRQSQQNSEFSALHRAVLASSTDYAIIAMDREGRVTLWNEGARRIMQWTEAEIVGLPAHVFFTPDEIANGIPEKEMAAALLTGRGEDERWHERKDGVRFWANGLMMPLRTEDDRHIGFIKILRDRTEARLAEEHRQLMLDELNHRVKNTLAVVQGIVSQTLRTAASPEAARRDVMERLTILSRAQDILTRSHWTGAPLRDVVEAATAPLIPAGGRLTFSGPDVDLGARAVLSVTMALHELGTNATKYGALSNAAGTVEIVWSVEDGQFDLVWRERGGPPVQPPTRQGFGSRLIESGLARGFGGKTALSFDPEGVSWTVHAPLAALVESVTEQPASPTVHAP